MTAACFRLLALLPAIFLVGCADLPSDGNDMTSDPADRSSTVTPGAVNAAAATAASAMVRTGNGIGYNGGPVVTGTVNVYYIWYGDWSQPRKDGSADDVKDILENLAQNIGGTPYWGINTLYTDRNGGRVSSQVRFGGSTTDASSQLNPATGQHEFSDAAFGAVVERAISQGNLPDDPNGVYFVLLGKDVNQCVYCGWHSPSTTRRLIAMVGNGETCTPSCMDAPSPNYNPVADNMATAIAHELAETVTDPYITAWATPMEMGDFCEEGRGMKHDWWNDPHSYTVDDAGTLANIRLGSRNYLLQPLWVPVGGGYCGFSYQGQTISVGPTHTLAIQTDGSLWAWGKNDRGQIGVAGGDRSKPVKVSSGGSPWVSVAAGNRFSIGLRADHTLWGWGDRSFGQLGDGANSTIQSTPKQIGGAQWEAVRAGDRFVIAQDTNATLWSWGYNANGQLGMGDQSIRVIPTQVGGGTIWLPPTTQLAAGQTHALAMGSDRFYSAWGRNDWGALGLGDTVQRLTPQPVDLGWPEVLYRLSAGTDFSLGVDNRGLLFSWGRNQYGQLGTSLVPSSLQPTQWITSYPTWETVAAGNRHGMAVRQDGTLWTWGSNSNGQLGTGVAVGTSFGPPTQESTHAASWLDAYAGGDTSMAVRADGSVWGWGNNSSFQLGLGNTTSPNQPAAVPWVVWSPTVVLTSPGDGWAFKAGDTVNLTVDVAGARINRVEYYFGNSTTPAQTVRTAPYSWNWVSPTTQVGPLTIRARVWNDTGDSAVSAPITIGFAKMLVTASTLTTPSTVEFTQQGTIRSIDWFHAGLTAADSQEVKNVGSHVFKDFSWSGATSELLQDPGNALTMHWTDGFSATSSQVGTASATVGVKPRFPGHDGYFSLSATGSTTTDRVVSFYFKVMNADVVFRITAGANDYKNDVNAIVAPPGIPRPVYRVYKVTYRAGLAGETVHMDATFNASLSSTGNVTFLGATMF